jgi:serine/threonine protein kinase
MRKHSSGLRRLREIVLQPDATPIPGYQLCQLRGQGSCGAVWEAKGPNGPVALKFMPCKQKTMVVQELRALLSLRELDHPHLLRYQQIWSHAGYIIFEMELAEHSLDELLKAYQRELGTGIVPEHLCLLLLDAARGIDYLNGRDRRTGGSGKGMQHCDIKPSNLLVCNDRVKVADFGLANCTNSGQETRALGGTPEFCSPEVFLGRVSNHTDQFALAVTYYQLRTGKLPFNDTPTSLSDPCKRLDPNLSLITYEEQRVVARALDPVASRRWTNCTEFIGQLIGVVHSPTFCSTKVAASA